LILDAALTLGIDLRCSITIGDKPSDIEAGVAAGTAAVMFGNLGHPLAEAAFAHWDDFERWIRSKS
jgi:beta-phosphoglucomutase-like phosphatase (HAD superfamily)